MRKASALELVKTIGAAEPGLRQALVARLDADLRLSRLIELAGHKQLFATAESAEATLAILKLRSPQRCREDLRALVVPHIEVLSHDGQGDAPGAEAARKKAPARLKVDLTMNRWEARMAYELLLLLPQADREALLAGKEVVWPDKPHARGARRRPITRPM